MKKASSSNQSSQNYMRQQLHNPNLENKTLIEQITFDPISKRTNIMKVSKALNIFVQQNFKTLSNCIATFELPEILAPNPPTLSNPFAGISPDNTLAALAPLIQLLQQATSSTATTSSTSSKSKKTSILSETTMPTRSRKIAESQEEEEDEDVEQSQPNVHPTTNQELPDIIKINMYTTQYQQYSQRMQLQTDELSNLFGIVNGLLSTSSKELVTSNINFENLEKSRNGLDLWKEVYRLHRCGDNHHDATYHQDELQRRYYSLTQKNYQTLDEYYELFKETIKNFIDFGIQTPSDGEQIIRFLNSLNKDLYMELHREINNNPHLNIERFKTLQEAYSYAVHYQPSSYQTRMETPVKNVFVSTSQPSKYCRIHNSNTHSTHECNQYKTRATKQFNRQPIQTKKKCIYHKNASNHTTEECNFLNRKAITKKTNGIVEFEVAINQRYLHGSSDPLKIYLDTAAQISIFNNFELLSNIKEVTPIKIYGVNSGSAPIIANRAGYLKGFSKLFVYASEDIKKNILRFSQVKDYYTIDWSQDQNQFTIFNDSDEPIIFVQDEDIYSTNLNDLSHTTIAVASISENKTKFSASEIERAQLVRTISERLAFESDSGLAKAVREGSILNLPINLEDISNAQRIFGKDSRTMKGKSVNQPRSIVEHRINKCPEKIQQLVIDIMYVNRDPYLISISVPMGLTMVDSLGAYDQNTSKSSKILINVILQQIKLYKSEGFIINKIICDNEPGIKTNQFILNDIGIKLEQQGSETHSTTIIDRKIRFIKERIRCIINNLPYKLPSFLLKWCIYFATSRINLICHSGLGSISPKEQFNGQRTTYQNDIRIAFGDYCQVHDPKGDNSMKPRTFGAIALLPTGSKTGSVYFYSLGTGKIVARDNFTIIPTPDEVINHMNNLASKSGTINDSLQLPKEGEPNNTDNTEQSLSNHLLRPLEDEYRMTKLMNPTDQVERSHHDTYGRRVTKTEDFVDINDSEEEETIIQDQTSSAVTTNPSDNTETEIISSIPSSDTIIPPTEDSMSLPILNPNTNSDTSAPKEFQTTVFPTKTRSGKIFPSILNISIEQALIEDPIDAYQAIVKELNQIVEKEVWVPIEVNSIKDISKAIPCKIFLKKKAEKWKARLVAGGHKQIKLLTSESYSPTAHIESIFIVCYIIAKEHLHVCTLDITGAYLNAEMRNDVYIRIPHNIATILIQRFPEYQNYINQDQSIFVKLKKALYGCIESAKLWYEDVSNYLIFIGFRKCMSDECIFIKTDSPNPIYVALYVDDFMIACKDINQIKEVETKLKAKYKEITSNYGDSQEYLGMEFDFSICGKVKITMRNYINKLLIAYHVKTLSKTPCSNDLFEPCNCSLLSHQQQQMLHCGSAQLLFLSKRARPDISLPTNYLCSHVNRYCIHHKLVFERVLSYLNQTQNEGITLSSDERIPTINIFADASYGINPDRKSQTGIVIQICRSTIITKCGKQKLVTKSSTEAELVAASESIS